MAKHDMTEEDTDLENQSVRQQIDSKGRFVKGSVPWNKGKTGVYTEETRRKISEKCRNPLPEIIELIRRANIGNKNHLGKPHSGDTKRRISEINRGRQPTDEARRK